MKAFYTLFLLFWAFTGTAQEVQLNEDPGISKLYSAWLNDNRTNPRISGWRVQIMASTDRQQIEQGYNQFRQRYSEIPAAWIQEKPYYKLRVGAFRSRQEALAFIANLPDYTGAYPAKDLAIHPRDFLE
jgi:septal ring-binding cell division protein DamX